MNNVFKDVLKKFPRETISEILHIKLFMSLDDDGNEQLSLNDVLAKKRTDDKVYKMLSEGDKFRFVSLKIQTQIQESTSTFKTNTP